MPQASYQQTDDLPQVSQYKPVNSRALNAYLAPQKTFNYSRKSGETYTTDRYGRLTVSAVDLYTDDPSTLPLPDGSPSVLPRYVNQ